MSTAASSILSYAATPPKFSVTGVNGLDRQVCLQQLEHAQQLMPYLGEREPSLIARLARHELYLALQPLGYYTPKIKAEITSKNPLTIQYHIDLGQPTLITKMEIDIDPQSNLPLQEKQRVQQALQQASNTKELKVGDTFNAATYKTEKKRLLRMVHQLGYLDADLNQSRVSVDGEAHSATIKWLVSPGNFYQFGQTIYQDSPLDTAFLNRYRPYQPGDPFSIDKIGRFEENLQKSGFFDFVAVEHHPDPNNSTQLITQVKTQSRQRASYQLGFGYDTLDHLRLLFGTQIKPVNAYGHSINSQLRLSENENDIIFNYTIPSTTPLTKNYVISLKLQTDLNVADGTSHSGNLSVTQANTRHGFKEWLSFHALEEHSEPDDGPNYDSTLFYPRYTIGFPIGEAQNADGIVEWSTLATAEMIGSTINLVQNNINWRYVWPHLSDPFRIANHGELGVMVTNDFDHVPLSMQYFTGGAQSVRGVSRDSIGPGHYLTVSGFDFQAQIPHTSWYVGPFVDFGDAFDDAEGLVTSSGLAFAWHSSIGDITLNIGRRIDQHDSLQFQISIMPIINIESTTSSLSQ